MFCVLLKPRPNGVPIIIIIIIILCLDQSGVLTPTTVEWSLDQTFKSFETLIQRELKPSQAQ